MNEVIAFIATYILTVFLLFMNFKFAQDLFLPTNDWQRAALAAVVLLIFAAMMSINNYSVGGWVVASSILALVTTVEQASKGWTFWWKLSVIPTTICWAAIAFAAYRAINQ